MQKDFQKTMTVTESTPLARSRFGFTLIEILMVVVIILIASAVAIPSFIGSYRGAKLRTSGRHIVMAGRFARSTAVLNQVQVALLFDAEAGSLEVVSIESADQFNKSEFLSGREFRMADDVLDDGAQQEKPKESIQSRLKRDLEEDVKVYSFESEFTEQEIEGIYWVNYYPNGMCDKYAVTLIDDQDQTMRIQVDPISGKAKVGDSP